MILSGHSYVHYFSRPVILSTVAWSLTKLSQQERAEAAHRPKVNNKNSEVHLYLTLKCVIIEAPDLEIHFKQNSWATQCQSSAGTAAFASCLCHPSGPQLACTEGGRPTAFRNDGSLKWGVSWGYWPEFGDSGWRQWPRSCAVWAALRKSRWTIVVTIESRAVFPLLLLYVNFLHWNMP